MGKHGKQSEHPPGTIWHEDASVEEKAGNFNAYERHLKDTAKPDDSNPYEKGKFTGE